MGARRPISEVASYEAEGSSFRPTIKVRLWQSSALAECRLIIDFKGIAFVSSEDTIPSNTRDSQTTFSTRLEDEHDIPEDDGQSEPAKILKEETKFNEITVWAHDRLPAADDTFVKGIEEWITFAEAVCVAPSQPPTKD